MKTGLIGRKILIVDDEDGIRDVLSDELTYCGAQVTSAGGGQEAVRLLEKPGTFDAIISDIRMPKGSGLDLLHFVKSTNVEKPYVLLITGFADLPAEKAFDLGADALLQKPFDLAMLSKELIRLMDQSSDPVSLDSKTQVNIRSTDLTSLRFGRRGFSIKNLEKNDTLLALKVGQTVFCDVDSKMKGTAVLRWVNRTTDTYGFEWLKVEGPGLEQVKKTLATIPFSGQAPDQG